MDLLLARQTLKSKAFEEQGIWKHLNRAFERLNRAVDSTNRSNQLMDSFVHSNRAAGQSSGSPIEKRTKIDFKLAILRLQVISVTEC